MTKLPPKDSHRIIIIGTTSNRHVLDELGLWDCFNVKVNVPELEAEKGEIQKALGEFLRSEQAGQISLDKSLKIPIKNLAFIAERLKLKLQENKDIDLKQQFFELYAQVQGIM